MCIVLEIKKSAFQKHMLNAQSVCEYLVPGMLSDSKMYCPRN